MRFLLIGFVIAGIGLSITVSNQAQQPATQSSQAGNSNAKPCIVVYGAVRSPARFELRREVRLAEALTMASGLTERIGETILVIHSGTQCFQGEPRHQIVTDVQTPAEVSAYEVSEVLRGVEKANPYLRAGDIVIANEIGAVYVTGNVKNPQMIFRKEPLTLMQALKLSGGALPNSRTNKVHIYRAKEGRLGAEDIMVDLNAAKKHRAKDPILQPYDIIDVPPKHGHGRPDPFFSLQSPKLASRIIQ